MISALAGSAGSTAKAPMAKKPTILNSRVRQIFRISFLSFQSISWPQQKEQCSFCRYIRYYR